MGKLLPLLLIVIGLGAGIGAGVFLQPAPGKDAAKSDCQGEDCAAKPKTKPQADAKSDAGEDAETDFDYVRLNNQFVVPVVRDGAVQALVVLSLTLEVEPGANEAVFAREPKLRDAFLQVLFDHANTGGFDASFTSSENMALLRGALLEISQKTLGEIVHDVLITEIVRQDV